MAQGMGIALKTTYAQHPKARVQQTGVTPQFLDPRKEIMAESYLASQSTDVHK